MYCIYHSRDLDGWCSAAIVKRWNEEVSDSPLKMIGWDYGDKIPELDSNEGVIMVDISFPMEEMEKIAKGRGFALEWIDHHKSAINDFKNFTGEGESFCIFSLDEKKAACELTWEYLFPDKEMPEFVRLLGRYDCFGHKGTDEEEKVLLFQYAARASVNGVNDCYTWLNRAINESYLEERMISSGRDIYAYLCTEAKQKYGLRFTVDFDGYKFATVNAERFNPINFGIQYHNDKADGVYYYDGACCFWYDPNKKAWVFSLYNDNGQVDCSEICKKRGGGGHKGASGFVTNDISFLME